MKKTQPSSRIVAVVVAAWFSAQAVQAAVITWNNAAGGNWSTSGNWSSATVPGPTDDVRFGNTGTGSINANDITAELINSLIYNQNNGTLNSTVINPGTTIDVNGGGAAGSVLFAVDSGASGAIVVPTSISGAGTLALNGLGNIVVRQCNTANGAQMATLDLSGLDTFNATAGRLLVGQAGASPDLNRPSGTLILAKTNYLTLNGGAPQVMVQDAGVNANGSVQSFLTFGQVNVLNAATLRLGGQKGNATVQFNPAFTAPSLTIRSGDGVSPCTVIDVGFNSAVSTGNNMVSTVNFSLGTVDILANLINVPQGPLGTGTGQSTGTLSIGDGVVTATTLEIGYGNATGTSGATTGTVNVNNNGLSLAGALVQAGTLRLARTNGGTATVNGTLNIDNATVQAGTILAGGGVSTINIANNGTLIVTNTAGTLAAPLRNFNIADTTLRLPALNGGAVIAVSNLTVGGSANTIHVTSVPPVGSYPATFTLISYLGGYTAGVGPISLGSLPAASPAYAGTLVDVGGGVIQLQLTAGPVVDLTLRWTGATDASWDSFTPNWLYQGNPGNFFAGAATLFSDTTTQTNVNLVEAVSPGSVTVSNNLYAYRFSGPGNIAGASALIKRGTSSLMIDNAGDNTIGNVQILAGTLQLGNGGTDGSIVAINITNNGTLLVNRDGSLALNAAISGTGTLTKIGPGALTLSGANAYSGTTVLAAGTLQMDGASGAGSLITSNGTLLAGSGTINGPATVRGQFNPGPVNGPGTFKAHGGFTLATGAAVTVDLSATDPSNPAANDAVEVFGNLALNNNVITVNIAGTPQPGASYLLFTYTGTLSGTFNPSIAGTHFAAAIDTATPGAVYLNITGSAGADLQWASTFDPAWDLTAINWRNLVSGSPSSFSAGDTVLLDDTNGVMTTLTIPAGLTVYPALVTNDSTNNFYTIDGPGRIGGSASIVKSGPSTLIVATPNNFTGPVEVQAGILQTGNGAALGTVAAGTTVQNEATLNLNGQNLGGEVVTLSGAGFGGIGALVNNGAGQAQALRQIILASDATIGGTGLIGVNNGGGGASLSTGGGSLSLTKVGPNQLTLQNTTIDAALADIHITQGTIEFSGLTATMGDPARTNLVEAGATLSVSGNSLAWNKNFVFNGNGTTTTFNNGASANTELAGPVEVHGDVVFNVGGTLLTISTAITGDGGLIKNGGSPLILNGVNTYKGDTRINTAALRLNGTGSIAGSSNIIINLGATLTVTGRVDSTFTMVSSQTLKGNGVINGHLVAPANTTVAPGVDAIGALTISNTITLGGMTVMELDEANATNDFLRCNQSITYGGTLKLENLGGPLSAGATFKLFNAASYLSSFSSINPPTPGPGQTWNTSALATSGTISVVGSPVLPQFGSVAVFGSNLVMSGSNGVPSGVYYVRASTDVALPLDTWARIATNSFDASGKFNFTNAITPGILQRFYVVELP
jgi:fibronectin-binding autotransporter adhesin